MCILIVTESLFLLSFVINIKVIFRTIAILTDIAESSHKLRQYFQHSPDDLLVSNHLIIEDMRKTDNNS